MQLSLNSNYEWTKVHAYLGVAVMFLMPTNIAAQCRTVSFPQKTSRHAVEDFQKWINEGHEPWRLDEADVVASGGLSGFHEEHKYLPVPKWFSPRKVKQKPHRVIFAFDSMTQGFSYKVTVRKFDWLLPVAKKFEWISWYVTEVDLVDCSGK